MLTHEAQFAQIYQRQPVKLIDGIIMKKSQLLRFVLFLVKKDPATGGL